MNIEFYKKMLTNDACYWVVAKKTFNRRYMETERGEDQIMFITRPYELKVYDNAEVILLSDIEKLERSQITHNIFLNTSYPPFQQGMSFYEVYEGFAVTEDIKRFIKEALILESDSIYDYEKLYKGLLEQETKHGK